jgi:hypothetical protein
MSASTPEGKCPGWAAKRYAPVSTELIADLQLWRAATQVDAGDLRPTGPPQLGRAAHVWQQRLDERLAAADILRDWHWQRLLASEGPRATADPFMRELAEGLSNHPSRLRRHPSSCDRRPPRTTARRLAGRPAGAARTSAETPLESRKGGASRALLRSAASDATQPKEPLLSLARHDCLARRSMIMFLWRRRIHRAVEAGEVFGGHDGHARVVDLERRLIDAVALLG